MRKIIPLLISLLAVGLLVFFSPWRLYERWVSYTPTRYKSELRQIHEKRVELANQHADEAVVKKAFVTTVTNRIIPYWYGTFWSFHGTTQTPGRGSIACGYFVITVLRDAGLQLNRSKLAQMPSEQMIKSLVAETHIQRFSNRPIGGFVEEIRKTGKGLYLVGLDNHTGFLVNDAAGIRFIHASGAFPFYVISEEALRSSILKKSRYRIVGRISEDKTTLQNWLTLPG